MSGLWVRGGSSHPWGVQLQSPKIDTDLSKEKMHRGSWGVTGLSKAGEVAGGSQAPGDGEMGGWAAIQPPPPGPPLRLITPHPQASSQAPRIQQEMNETRPFRMRSAGGQGPQASFRACPPRPPARATTHLEVLRPVPGPRANSQPVTATILPTGTTVTCLKFPEASTLATECGPWRRLL